MLEIKRNIPFSPPDISEAEVEEVAAALRSGWITTGPRTKQLEKNIAEWIGVEKCVCLNSQTACAEMALRLMGIGEGDELTGIIRRFVLIGGMYGNNITSKESIHHKQGGKIRYILWLFLPDRTEMERRYPELKEKPKKLPYYHLKRWAHLIFGGRIRSSAKIISENMAIPNEDIKKLDFMKKEMGL